MSKKKRVPQNQRVSGDVPKILTAKKKGLVAIGRKPLFYSNVGLTGVEPAHLAVLEPKSSASASSATAPKSVSVLTVLIIPPEVRRSSRHGDDPHLQVRFNFLVKVNSHGIQPQLFERALQANLVIGHNQVHRSQSSHDL